MKAYSIALIVFFTFASLGCEIPQVVRPLRLYDLADGKIIEVFLQRSSPNSGKLVSARIQSERFEGEFVLYGVSPGNYVPRREMVEGGAAKAAPENPSASLAELYGFGKETDARPVGTAILVGNQGTTIEIVIYRISPDLQYGDGVARDNKGRHYRVFLSVEG